MSPPPDLKPALVSPLDVVRPHPEGDAPQDAALSLFARRVLQRAAQRGLNKKTLAARAALSRQTLDNLLQLGTAGDAAMPSVRSLMTLAAALKVHPFWLVEGLMAHVRLSMHLREQMRGQRVGYIEDVSSPDGCVLAPGAHFLKSWSAHNLSVLPWPGHKLVCWDQRVEMSAERLGGGSVPVQRLVPDVQEFEFGTVEAGATFNGAIGFTAPTTPGPAASYWVLTEADGRVAFNESIAVWLIVQVEPDASVRAMSPRTQASHELGVGDMGLAWR